jgi:hypothetical protein
LAQSAQIRHWRYRFTEKVMLMPRSYSVWLALSVLACCACAPEAAPPPAPEPVVTVTAAPVVPAPADDPPMPIVAAAVSTDLLGWWDRPEALARLGLTAAEGAALAAELDKREQTYQTAQRQLPTVRQTQMQMLQDRKVPSADIRRFNQRNLQWLLTTMADENVGARLWVRDHLSADQFQRVLDHSPRFFGRPWFRAAEDPSQVADD